MKTTRFLPVAWFALLLFCNMGFAQNITVTTATPGSWSADQTSGMNLTASAAAAQIAGLGFGTAPVAYTNTCTNQNANPAAQMTYPTGAGAQCGNGSNMTRYYRTVVNINTCESATFSIRADDAFRVFINGTQLTNGSLSLSGCSGFTLTELSGNAWGTTYTFNLNPSHFIIGANTVVIEVANCTGVSYVAASLVFQPAPALPATNQISYSVSANPPTGYTVGLWGINPKTMKIKGYDGMWTGNWLIQSGPSTSGPWTFFGSNSENSSTPTTPWYPAMFSYGTYYRVTYTITTTCGYTATYTTIIYICTGCVAPPGPAGDVRNSLDEAAELSEKMNHGATEVLDLRSFSNYQDSIYGTYGDVIANAYVDNLAQTLVINTNEGQEDAQIDILSMEGRLMWTNKFAHADFQIDVSGWQEGIYVVYARTKGIAGIPKKVVILRE